MRAVVLALLLLSACAKPADPEIRCFIAPHLLYCSQLADGDGE